MKIAMVYNQYGSIPGWVVDQFQAHQIELVNRDCENSNEVVALAHDADVVWDFAGSNVITAECLSQLKRCRVILRSGTGTDNIPVQAATQLGIIVANTPEATTQTVAEHAVGLMLAVARNIVDYDRTVRDGRWRSDLAWPKAHLSGQTLGLVGFGRIAQAVRRMVAGFQMTVLATDPVMDALAMTIHHVDKVDLPTLLGRSDFVSLHVPLLESTRHLIAEVQLKQMRPHAVLINTARGAIIDEEAMIRALQEGWIGGAGLDVLEMQPPAPGNLLMSMPNVVLTPHVSGYNGQFWEKFWSHSVRTLLEIAGGKMPIWYVNRDVVPRRMMAV